MSVFIEGRAFGLTLAQLQPGCVSWGCPYLLGGGQGISDLEGGGGGGLGHRKSRGFWQGPGHQKGQGAPRRHPHSRGFVRWATAVSWFIFNALIAKIAACC